MVIGLKSPNPFEGSQIQCIAYCSRRRHGAAVRSRSGEQGPGRLSVCYQWASRPVSLARSSSSLLTPHSLTGRSILKELAPAEHKQHCRETTNSVTSLSRLARQILINSLVLLLFSSYSLVAAFFPIRAFLTEQSEVFVLTRAFGITSMCVCLSVCLLSLKYLKNDMT